MFETKTYKKLKDKPRNNNPKLILVHHSGGTDANPLADTSHHTAAIMEAHHLSLGWDGLGYHYVIHKNGDVWKGRPEHRNGAHEPDVNTTSIGICLAGNFDATLPTKNQEIALAALMKDICSRNNIPLTSIDPHRKFANKTCYGKKLTDDWARRLVEVPVTPQPPIAHPSKASILAQIDSLRALVEAKL